MKAKNNSLLADISASFAGSTKTTTVDVCGRKYTLTTLKPEAENWVVANTAGTTSPQLLLNIRAPSVAAALVAIDDEPVERLFIPDGDLEPEVLSDKALMRAWRRRAILEWLNEEGAQFQISALYKAYESISIERDEMIKAASNLANGTP